MIISPEDKALYLSTKDVPLTQTDTPTIMEVDPIVTEVKKPVLQEVSEPEKTVDTGNGIFALKPSVEIKTLDQKPLYVDVEKLLHTYDDNEAEKIVTDLTNKDLPDETLQKLILNGTITETQPVKTVKKETILDKITNFLYNLIYN